MKPIEDIIRQCAADAAAAECVPADPVEHFLRTGEESEENRRSRSRVISESDRAYASTRALKAALRALFQALAPHLPAEPARLR